MMDTRKRGNKAELRACEYLLTHGLSLIEKNFSCSCGEIDLIMRDKNEIVFVEVRSCNGHIDQALESVNYLKQTKLVRTATYYLQKKRWLDTIDCRFDVVAMNEKHIEWIKQAFFADNF